MGYEIRRYRNEDLALMPPRACEAGSAELERELEYIGQIRLANPGFTLWGGHFKTEPIGAAGIIIFQPGVGEAWLRGSKRMDECGVVCALELRRGLRMLAGTHSLRRVQMMVMTEDECAVGGARFCPTETPALRLAMWLGFEIEGLMRKAGPEGENFYMMAWLPEAGNGTAEPSEAG